MAFLLKFDLNRGKLVPEARMNSTKKRVYKRFGFNLFLVLVLRN